MPCRSLVLILACAWRVNCLYRAIVGFCNLSAPDLHGPDAFFLGSHEHLVDWPTPQCLLRSESFANQEDAIALDSSIFRQRCVCQYIDHILPSIGVAELIKREELRHATLCKLSPEGVAEAAQQRFIMRSEVVDNGHYHTMHRRPDDLNSARHEQPRC